MPFAQLITSGIELAINQLLNLDPDSQQRLKKLAGKSLQVSLEEFPWPLLFSFSQQVDVRIVEDTNMDIEPADCVIGLKLETLPKLKDSSQLTQLIQQKKLTLVGDIYVAQSFSALIKDLDIDWEEQLSHYSGDVVAHQTFSTMRTLFDSAKAQIEQGAVELSERLTQSDSIAVKPSEMLDFSKGVSDLRSASERIAARLALLEQAQNIDIGAKD